MRLAPKADARLVEPQRLRILTGNKNRIWFIYCIAPFIERYRLKGGTLCLY